MTLRLSDITALLDGWYPPAWAADWDAVGLVCGDPEQPVSRVLFAVDPAPGVVAEAAEWGADLVVCHHPLLLTPVHGVAADTPKGRVVHGLVRTGTALFTAHTNADVSADGVNESLARAVGIVDPRVVVDEDDTALDKLVVFVPDDHADAVRSALAAAGAGAVGDYDQASFTSAGEGRFRPLHGARPAVGRVGEPEVVAEARIEVVLPRTLRKQVLDAMRSVHPYEEPAYDLLELAAVDQVSSRGHGRIGRLAEPTTLREFAARVDAALPRTAHGVRVAGDPDRRVENVAVGSGAGDFMLDDVLGTAADVYVTSDLRHHRAAEFLEHGGPALVDVAHWAAEWTWLPVVEHKLREAVAAIGDTVETRVSDVVTDPWTFRADR
ncbi:MAG: Nif3-like dinuclear metal center hexameric protein [Nocardioidaceae bacterium]